MKRLMFLLVGFALLSCGTLVPVPALFAAEPVSAEQPEPLNQPPSFSLAQGVDFTLSHRIAGNRLGEYQIFSVAQPSYRVWLGAHEAPAESDFAVGGVYWLPWTLRDGVISFGLGAIYHYNLYWEHFSEHDFLGCLYVAFKPRQNLSIIGRTGMHFKNAHSVKENPFSYNLNDWKFDAVLEASWIPLSNLAVRTSLAFSDTFSYPLPFTTFLKTGVEYTFRNRLCAGATYTVCYVDGITAVIYFAGDEQSISFYVGAKL